MFIRRVNGKSQIKIILASAAVRLTCRENESPHMKNMELRLLYGGCFVRVPLVEERRLGD